MQLSIRDWPAAERPAREAAGARRPGALGRRAAGAAAGLRHARAHRRSTWRAAAARDFGSLRELLSADRRALPGERAASGRRATPPCRRPSSSRAGTTARRCAPGPALDAPDDHAQIPAGAAARSALRGVLLPVPRQPPPAHRLRGAVPRHHRRRQRPSARGRATDARSTTRPRSSSRTTTLPGSLEPSQADELITRRLREALALVDVRRARSLHRRRRQLLLVFGARPALKLAVGTARQPLQSLRTCARLV